MALSQLPVISYQRLSQVSEQRRLRQAASDVGFFYLVDHGLSPQQLHQVLAVAHQFFALPQQVKNSVDMINSPHFRGYNQVGSELTAGAVDVREQFDWMQEHSVKTSIEYDWQRLYGPNLWPQQLPQLRRQLLALTEQQTHIAITLLRALCSSLGMDQNALDDTFADEPYTHSKIIRYPGSAQSRQGVGAHKDPGYLTFVLQDEQSGLQVQHGDQWIMAEPLAGAFVVNIGELLELASDGFLQATNHRVLAPKPGTERYSVAFFMAAQLDKQVPVLQLPEAMKARSKGVSSDPNNPLLKHVGENVLKGRLRSHPKTAQRFYRQAVAC